MIDTPEQNDLNMKHMNFELRLVCISREILSIALVMESEKDEVLD